MDDDTSQRHAPLPRVKPDGLHQIVRHALGKVAADATAQAERDAQNVALLCEAALCDDSEAHQAALTQIRATGVTANETIDFLIPEAARCMGVKWFADEVSFVDVTIGTARLQEVMRSLTALGREAYRGDDLFPNSPEVLLVLPMGEMHSLGVFVAADQFRRLGYRVTVIVGQEADHLRSLLMTREFALIGVTVSARRTLALAKVLVENIRHSGAGQTPIVVGGPLAGMGVDVLSETRADHVVCSVQGALSACGLSPLTGQAGHIEGWSATAEGGVE